MTGPEREDLRLALDILRDWRKDDTSWKEDIIRRLGILEDRFVAIDALAKAEAEKLSRRFFADQRRNAVISIVSFVIGGIAYALANGLL